MRFNTAKLRSEMFNKDTSQLDLSRQTGISRPTINGICCGRSCTSNTAEKIAEALQIPLEDLIENGGS